jgi:hypothetical protein
MLPHVIMLRQLVVRRHGSLFYSCNRRGRSIIFFIIQLFNIAKNSKPKKEKPLHIKDQIRNELLSKGAEAGLSSEDDADEDHPKVRQSKEKLT